MENGIYGTLRVDEIMEMNVDSSQFPPNTVFLRRSFFTFTFTALCVSHFCVHKFPIPQTLTQKSDGAQIESPKILLRLRLRLNSLQGFAVEVSSDDDGFRGSLFSCKIVLCLSNDRFLMEYDNLKRLREVLHLHQLRPVPPDESDQEFKFGEEVDAFHDDGWWKGHITEECGDGRFAVYFRALKEQIVFSKEQLGAHCEWSNQGWVPPLSQTQQQL